MTVLLGFLGGIWNIAKVTIPVPLIAIVAAWIWVQHDKGSAVREALNKAVAGAELEAAREIERGLQIIIEEKNRREALLKAANEQFRARVAEANRANEDLTDEIDELLARSVDGACAVDDAIFDLLRNN